MTHAIMDGIFLGILAGVFWIRENRIDRRVKAIENYLKPLQDYGKGQ
jgi:hypothetical protein